MISVIQLHIDCVSPEHVHINVKVGARKTFIPGLEGMVLHFTKFIRAPKFESSQLKGYRTTNDT